MTVFDALQTIVASIGFGEDATRLFLPRLLKRGKRKLRVNQAAAKRLRHTSSGSPNLLIHRYFPSQLLEVPKELLLHAGKPPTLSATVDNYLLALFRTRFK